MNECKNCGGSILGNENYCTWCKPVFESNNDNNNDTDGSNVDWEELLKDIK